MQLADDPQMIQQVRHIHCLIGKRIGRHSLKSSLQPMWYRGLSDTQLAAAHGLERALGDDILQGSAHRSHHQLTRLGVSPRPQRSGLRLLLQMSRGNDVAFLWFLMEMFYKSNNSEVVYQFNEQIIMSAIFWLDFLPTLHELDRVLPLPHASEAERLKHAQAQEREQKQLRLKHLQEQTRLKRRPKSQPNSMASRNLPYFEKPVLRNPRPRRLIAHHPKRPLLLHNEGGNPAHLTSRWFGDYQFNNGECVAKSVLNEQVHNVVASLLNADQVKSVCAHHKEINEMEQSLHLNLERIKQEQYERLIDVDYHRKKRTRQRILEDLDRMSEQYRARFHDMAVKASTRIVLDNHDPGFICLGKNDTDRMSEDYFCGTVDSCKGFKLITRDASLPPTCRDNSPIQVNLQTRQRQQKLNVFDSDHRLPEVVDTQLSAQYESLNQFRRLGGTEMEEESRAQQSESPPCQCTNRTDFFEVGPAANLYKFNYKKLFAPSRENLLDNQELRIKAECIKALDEDADYLNAVLDGTEGASKSELVDRAAKRIFREGTELFQEEFEKAQRKDAEQRKTQRLNFGQEYYDADDLALMKEMLRVGLERVAEDKRFVLPTLPDVHCVPLLLDWIQSRYGKRYSQADRMRSFVDAKVLMDHLTLMMAHNITRTPCWDPYTQSKRSTSSTFAPHNEQRAKLKNYWRQYSKHFIVSLLEMSRVFLAAMNTKQGRPTSATYYAYMPAHLNDVQFSNTAPTIRHHNRPQSEDHIS